MKKTIYSLLVAAVVGMGYSCKKVDNYAGPNAAFQGNVIDVITGKNLLTESGGYAVQLDELSWSSTPTPYYIPAKQDGTYEDTRIFSGHYRVTPTQGAFWPLTDTTYIDIAGNSSHDFKVTPYLEIQNFTWKLSGTTLQMTFNLFAPKSEGMPDVIDIQPFVNNTPFVGSGATIYNVYTGPNIKTINAPYTDVIAKTTYTLTVPNLLSGRTFYARVGVRVNDSYKKFNYSEIVKVDVP
ncbi:DUF3823 domain-containing protein [Chitinophaga sp. Cy-1792]|uniref:DUF3823 domain-containing protein n=1 Tax=Chitinophaga sp. Cy-1792 TaxID=2608339 RepID=UPI00141EE958|nr:DUF3823 domain-containing protein [Chitinophaga sp. Cy-1792]NIG54955.1 DUF3823 domain-containing protein [Chitinophaga sp. Cy-1792]